MVFSFRKYILILLSVLLFAGCRSEFEKIRTSGDAAKIYNKAMAYYDQEEWQKAQSLMELIINSYKGTPKAEELYYKYAYTYYNTNQFLSAAFHFETFGRNFPSSELREETAFMQAYSHYLLSPTYRLDQTYSLQAIEEMQLFVNTYPNSPKVEVCNNLIDEMRSKMEKKAFEQGRLYFDMTQYEAAVQAFNNVLLEYPETGNAEEIHRYIVRSNFLLADNSVYDKKKERFQDAQKAAQLFLKKYPDSPYAIEVKNYLNIASQNIKNLIQ